MDSHLSTKYRPHHLLAVTLVSVILIERFVMLALMPRLHTLNTFSETFIDPLLIGLMVFPILHFFLFRPLLIHIADQNRVKESLKKTNSDILSAMAELKERNAENAILSEMDDLLHSSRSNDEAYSVIKRVSADMFPSCSGALMILSASRNYCEAVVSLGGELACKPEYCTPDECWALRRGQTNIVKGSASGFPCKHSVQKDNYVCAPLIANGESIGVLYLEFPEAALTDASLKLTLTLARRTALALANLRLNDTLRMQSIKDPLTGLFNRRYMNATLERELYRSRRKNIPLGVIMIDLDHFKKFNDTFGHDAGDSVLHEFASFLQKVTRGEDVVCRYGGEEFIIILHDASLGMITKRAEKLRDDVKCLDLRHEGQPLGAITMSMGVAAFPDHGSTADTILDAADRALYRAKAEGRDRVVEAKKTTGSNPI
ncbi:MAG: GGDEF domain-containing protein [Deltaproteobacteria bacterium]|nr:GGDEF domain-containing protein [Deltaproteobacteria bacterium]